MSLDIVERAMRTLLPHTYSECSVSLLGGEPLLHPDFESIVSTIVRESSARFIQVALNVSTNGTVSSSKIVKCLQTNRIKTSMSIDGPQSAQDALRPMANGKGSFEVAFANLEYLWDQLGPELLSVRITCTTKNISVIPDFISSLSRAFPGIRTEIAPVILPSGNPLSLFSEGMDAFLKLQRHLFRDEFARHGNSIRLVRDRARQKLEIDRVFLRRPLLAKCEVGMNLVSVATNGDVYPCVGFADDDTYRLGNVIQGTLGASDHVSDIYERNSVLTRSECQTCWAKYLCAGGCIAVNRTVTGQELFVNRDLCEMYKGAAEILLLGSVVGIEVERLGLTKVDWC